MGPYNSKLQCTLAFEINMETTKSTLNRTFKFELKGTLKPENKKELSHSKCKGTFNGQLKFEVRRKTKHMPWKKRYVFEVTSKIRLRN